MSESFGSHTNQRRHLLFLRSGPWSFVNVHAESGPDADARDKRAWQFQRLSREHVLDAAHVPVLAGDFNIRDGEELCFLSEGWTDAWCAASKDAVGEEWTWKRGNSCARWDRIYTHSTSAFQVRCSHYARLAQAGRGCTDHVAVHVVLQLTELPTCRGVADAVAGPWQGASSSVAHSSGQRSQASKQPVEAATGEKPTSTRPKAQRPQTANCANRADIPIVKIANAVTRAVDDAQKTFSAIVEDPSEKTIRPDLAVPHWNDLPRAGGFKKDWVRQQGSRHRATDADKEQQRRDYAKYVGWVVSSGLREEHFANPWTNVGQHSTDHGINYVRHSRTAAT